MNETDESFTPQTTEQEIYFAGASPDLCEADEVLVLDTEHLQISDNKKFFDALSDINLCQSGTYLAEAKYELVSLSELKAAGLQDKKREERRKLKLAFWFLHNTKDNTSDSVCAVAVTRLITSLDSTYVYVEHICYRKGTAAQNARKLLVELLTYAKGKHASFMLAFFNDYNEPIAKALLGSGGFKKGASNSIYYRLDGSDEDPVSTGQTRDEHRKKTRK